MKKIFLTLIVLFSFTGAASAADFILVHGSWHGAWCWYKIETLLKQKGHRVISVDLPSHGKDKTLPENVSLIDYRDKVILAIEEIESDDQLILVGHSMGGIVASSAAGAIPYKVDKIVYLAAFMLDQGQTMNEVSSNDVNSLINNNSIFPVDEGHALDIRRDMIASIFYKSSNVFDITLAEQLLTIEPITPIGEPMVIADPGYWDIPRYYIQTMEDKAISPEVQQEMINRIGVDMVFPIYTDHSPFFSRPYHLLTLLENIAAQ